MEASHRSLRTMPRRLLRFVSSRLNACTLAGHGLETDDNTAPAQINSNAPSQGLEAPRSLSLPWLHLLPPVPPQQCELVQLVISRRAQHRLTRVLGQASGTASLTGIAIRQDRAEEDAAITNSKREKQRMCVKTSEVPTLLCTYSQLQVPLDVRASAAPMTIMTDWTERQTRASSGPVDAARRPQSHAFCTARR